MRIRSIALLSACLLAGVTSASASPFGSALEPPVFASDNVDLLATIPTGAAMSSIAFSSTSPHAFVSTFRGLEVLDISNPRLPLPVAELPLAGHSNEAMSLGERPNGDAFVLFGSNSAAADGTGFVNATNRVVTVVEVTNPRSPKIVGHLQTPTRTHTVSCLSPTCEYAYTDGRSQGGMSVVDLTDFRNPKLARADKIVTPVTLGHDEDYDEAGVMWHVGGEGAVALDTTDPANPVALNSTDENGLEGSAWNRFIQHNSYRPNAGSFAHETDEEGNVVRDENGLPTSGEPSLDDGNVLLVTEEFLGTNLNTPTCVNGDGEGAFSTWHIPFLDAGAYATLNPTGTAKGKGTIAPLDKWNTELADSGMTVRIPGFCSAHYFDYHSRGVVAQGFYEQGTRFLDVRDPTDIKQIGYFFLPASETWGAYWVPKYRKGKQTGADTNIVYTADNNRGIDVLEIDLGSLKKPKETKPVKAPILESWVKAAVLPSRTSSPSADWGWLCRIG